MKRILSTFLVSVSLLSAAAQKTETLYLSGTELGKTVKWDFWCSAGMNAGKWSKIEVPSCWEQQGFGGYTYGRYYIYNRESEKSWHDYREHQFTDEYGIYRHQFKIPKSWEGKQISIVFEGVMTDAEVKVNGQLAGPTHQGAFYRFTYDIADKLQYGRDNLLEVKVLKQSADPSVNASERRADWWLFGGIYRPVYLTAKPKTQIDHIAVDARVDGTLLTDLYLKGVKEGQKIEFTLTQNGSSTPMGTQVCKISGQEKQSFRTTWDNILPWDPEHPNLYRLTLRLLAEDNQPIHEITERIGFRTIEFRPQDGLYLNGVKLLVKGTNRHCFDPEGGRTTNKALDLQDARLIKQMNMNAVRSHYPPDVHFLEVCDSIGLLYLDELCGWQNAYSKKVAERLLPEMIFRDVNHPCIFIWSNGNEGGWNTSIDSRFADYDPQKRHVVHPWADFNQLDTRHYPTSQDYAYRLEHGQKVFMMTEFLHGLYDRGQGAGLDGLWNKFRQSPLFAGGFLWAFVDEALLRSDTHQLDTYGPNAPDGIVGAYRQKEGSFYTVREIWSPIQVKPFTARSGFKGDFYVKNDWLFSHLNENRMTWKVLKQPAPHCPEPPSCLAEGNVELPSINPGETGLAHFNVPQNYESGDILELEAYNHRGDTLCTWTFPIKTASQYHSAYSINRTNSHPASFTEADSTISLSANGIVATFHGDMLKSISNHGKMMPLSNGPLPEGIKMSMKSHRLYMKGDTAIYCVKYDGAVDSIVWRMTPDGMLGMDAILLNHRNDNHFKGSFFDKNIYNLGFSFSYPEDQVKGMRWLGKGPYRVWKNRIKGVNYNIWQKDKNNTVTGEYYEPLIYPEFKGYHANIYWATLLSEDSPITIYSETDGLYFRIFTPEEQRDREGRGLSVLQYPSADISFLFAIPAVNSQGTEGQPYVIKINKGDEGFRMKVWFKF